VSGSTALYAVFGRPVSHSRSPALHNPWFRHYGIDATYVAVEVPEGEERLVVRTADRLGLAGANVTAPLKVAVAETVGRLEGDAALIGAVNLLFRDGGSWVGANTDATGLVLALREAGDDPTGRRAAVVGCGGAGRAAAFGLARANVEHLTLVNRAPAAAEHLAMAVRVAVPGLRVDVAPLEPSAVLDDELVVLAVSADVDLAPPRRPGAWIDLRYGTVPPATSAMAAAAGHRVSDGSSMLFWQGALSFERWTGHRPSAPL
jgi:shikimate dehydrogenase